jgi:hypothetical protein
MSNANSNAYPDGGVTHANGQAEWGQPGLTKRELFAAMMLQGMMADGTRTGTFAGFAKEAIQQADALLAQLSSGNGESR